MTPLPKRKLSKGRKKRRRTHHGIKSVSKVKHKKILGRKFSAKEKSN